VEIVDKILSYFFWKVRSERLQAILFEIWLDMEMCEHVWMLEHVARVRAKEIYGSIVIVVIEAWYKCDKCKTRTSRYFYRVIEVPEKL